SFRGHRNRVSQLVFTANSRRLVTVGDDMMGLVWDTSPAGLAKPEELGTAEQRERTWGHLALLEWELAGPAVAALGERPNELISLVRERMKPAGALGVDANAVAKLIAQLDDEVFAVRERAAAALARLGREALPLLQEHLAKATSPQTRNRIRK